MWKGKNFVFDGRGAHGAQTLDDNTNGSVTKKEQVVGTCLYCPTPYDVFEPGCVCTVCRELTLVCPKCRQNLHEYHCHLHAHLRHCYFTDLKPFTRSDLESQLNELKALIVDIAVGKKYKHKRKTLTKQCDKINHRLVELENIGTTDIEMQLEMERKCRNCGQPGCSGNCWGCHGLKRKRILEEMHKNINDSGSVDGVTSNSVPAKGVPLNKSHNAAKEGNNGHLQKRKALERQNVIDELIQLKLASSPSEGRNKTTGIRIPTSCTRTLQTNTKGKWCGKSLLSVLQTEFAELAQTGILCTILQRGLLRVNDKTINGLEEATALKLKNMDVIVRVNHWHEPPVHIPSAEIDIQKVILPRSVQDEYNLEDDSSIFVCDKPSTVPVHPAGPYLSNSLTMMVEAQEGMIPKTLIPCHRIDRVTSGLTLCCTNPKVARLVQSRIDGGFVKKQYLAKVHGKFPNQTSDMKIKATEIATWSWSIPDQMLEVNAPIETVDPSNGIRMITSKGKAARSLFRLIGHDEVTNTSMVLCSPLTGRSHQLRVHLQWLGHSIVNDIQYGGTVDASLDVGAGLAESKQRRQQELEGGNIISLHSSSISEADAKAAMDICTFCTQGPEKAFTPAQLLQGGHLICLHAWRYKIPFVGKKSGNAVDSSVPLAELDLQVGMPSWAFGTDSLLSILSG